MAAEAAEEADTAEEAAAMAAEAADTAIEAAEEAADTSEEDTKLPSSFHFLFSAAHFGMYNRISVQNKTALRLDFIPSLTTG